MSIRSIFAGKCPKCNAASLFRNYLDLADTCPHCSLALYKHDVGDGAIYISLCIVSFVVTFLAVYTSLQWNTPMWLNLIIWIPAIVLGSIYCLRITKAFLIAMEYKYRPETFT